MGRRDKTGDDEEVDFTSVRQPRLQLTRRRFPINRNAVGGRLNYESLASIKPTGAMISRFQKGVEELRRPQLAVTGDEFDDALRCEPGDPNTSQHFFDRVEIGNNRRLERGRVLQL